MVIVEFPLAGVAVRRVEERGRTRWGGFPRSAARAASSTPPTPDGRASSIATTSPRTGALALTQDGRAGHGYILNGPQALTAREQVQTLAEVLGRTIEFVPLTPEELARHSVEHGTPPEMAGAVQNLNELFRASRAGVLADDITNLTGLAPRTFRLWAEHHAGAVK